MRRNAWKRQPLASTTPSECDQLQMSNPQDDSTALPPGPHSIAE